MCNITWAQLVKTMAPPLFVKVERNGGREVDSKQDTSSIIQSYTLSVTHFLYNGTIATQCRTAVQVTTMTTSVSISQCEGKVEQ